MSADGAVPHFVCPRCRGPLITAENHYECERCAETYPVILGIPDFRVEPDPWISIEDDRAKGEQLAERIAGLDLANAVEAYWEMTPDTPRSLAMQFIRHVIDGEARASEWIDSLTPVPSGRVLDIGCGTGETGVVLGRRGEKVAGVDVAFRWLVLAQHRFRLSNSPATVVCANAEHLPFPDHSFDHVVTLGTIEHVRDARTMMRESARVLVPHGAFDARTTNRFSLLREPHVQIWGVGLIPRAFADRYVRWRGGQGYAHHKPLSVREMRGIVRDSGFEQAAIGAAAPLEVELAKLSRNARTLATLYSRVRATPLLGRLVSWIAPVLSVRART